MYQNYINITIKYIIIIGLLYLILKKFPNNEIKKKDIILIIIVILIGFIFIDYLFIKKTINNDPVFNKSYNLCSNVLPKNKYENFSNSNFLCSDSNNPLCNLSSDQVLEYMYNILSQKTHVSPSPSPSQTQQLPEPLIASQDPEQPEIVQPVQPVKQVQSVQNVQPSQQSDINNNSISQIQQFLNDLNQTNLNLNDTTYDNIIEQLKNLSYEKINKLYTFIDKINESPSLNIFKKYINQLLLQNKPKEIVPDLNNNINPSIAFKYIEVLISDLLIKNIINDDDVNNIKIKLESKIISIQDVIESLEKLKKYSETITTKQNLNNDLKYNELPLDFFKPIGDKISNDWSNDYTILNTDKWKVPLQRPPLCINTNPCKVCPNDTNYPVNLKSWDESRVISKTNINKNWISNQ